MCGRLAGYISRKELADLFEVEEVQLDLPLRYNIVPTQRVAALGETKEGKRKMAVLCRGLVPAWASDPPSGAKTFDARADTLTRRPT